MKVSRLWRSLLAVGMLCFAGFKVGSIALAVKVDFFESTAIYWFIGAWIFFDILVFPRAIKPNAQYVLSMSEPAPIYHCFRPRSWLIIIFMMGLGISVRAFGWASDAFIAGFYSGLSLSLLHSTTYYIAPIRAFIKEGK